MTKIYLVTSGEYSDYRVDAAFSSEEKAEAFISANGHREYNGIVEYDLDPEAFPLPEGMHYITVIMTRDGTARAWVRDSIWEGLGTDMGFTLNKFERCPWEFYCRVLARDEAHAVKIVNEKRVQLIANNEWQEKQSNEA